MIKNERQYKITKAQAEKFATALDEVPSRTDADPLLAEIEQKALRSQLDELNQQLEEYEQLQSGERGVIYVDSFDQLSTALVKARIATGLSQKELAERLGLKEQQIQRYEATDYRSASLARLQEIIAALGVKVRKEVFLPVRPANAPALFDRLNAAGVEHDLILHRILPPAMAERMRCTSPAPSETEVRHAATTIGRVFQWDVADVLGDEPLTVASESAGVARFKLASRSDERKLSAYTVYAHYLALLVMKATPELEPQPIPTDADECRDAILDEFGAVSFENVLSYVWNLGVPVLPLCDAGAFHGACWRMDGRNIIVLKQRTCLLARWTYDGLHETFHAGQEPEQNARSVLEEPETSESRRESQEEREANQFAGDVMLDGRAEELIQMCVDAAGGNVPRLKAVVPMVAESEDVDTGALANYMAYRLSLQGINWWGTATNLQRVDSDPWVISRDWLVSRLDLTRLNDVDRAILTQALTKTEE